MAKQSGGSTCKGGTRKGGQTIRTGSKDSGGSGRACGSQNASSDGKS